MAVRLSSMRTRQPAALVEIGSPIRRNPVATICCDAGATSPKFQTIAAITFLPRLRCGARSNDLCRQLFTVPVEGPLATR